MLAGSVLARERVDQRLLEGRVMGVEVRVAFVILIICSAPIEVEGSDKVYL